MRKPAFEYPKIKRNMQIWPFLFCNLGTMRLTATIDAFWIMNTKAELVCIGEIVTYT